MALEAAKDAALDGAQRVGQVASAAQLEQHGGVALRGVAVLFADDLAVSDQNAANHRIGFDAALTASVASYEPDLVVSAGFLKLVGARFLAAFADRYVNTHNSLLPSFVGIHGPRDALAYGVKIAGATLFFVDDGVDTGPIIAQVAVPVLDEDTEDTLTERIKEAERRQLVDAVGAMVRGGWTIAGRKVTIG